MLTASVNVGPLIAKLQKLGIATRKPMQDLIRQQGKLLISEPRTNTGMIQNTPPSNSGARGKAAQRQGENAILRDLLGGKNASGSAAFRGIFFVMSDSLIAQAKEYHSSGNVRLFIKRGGSGTVYGCDRIFYRPRASVEEMHSHHRQYFKNGRMTQAGARTRDIGRWKFIDQMVVSQSAMNRYLKWIYKKVGTLASGFNAAAAQLGASVPAWITRHGTRYSGFGIQQTPTSFYIVLSDNVPFGQADTVRRLRYVLRYRERALATNTKHIIRAAIKQAGFAATLT